MVCTAVLMQFHAVYDNIEVRTHVRPFSSTLIGSLPCSSASMSEGLQEWKAPLQMKRM